MLVSASRTVIGRYRELEALEAALGSVVQGRGQLVLLSGEPGAGKTTLAERAADEADRLGAEVLWGACWKDPVAPAYWPWIQAFRAGSHHALPAALDAFGRSRPSLAAETSSEARFRLFDEVATALRAAATARPLAIVLDDAQWADLPSLSFTAFVGAQLRDLPLMVLVAFRSTELTEGRRRVLGRLTRAAVRVDLTGLREHETGEILRLAGAQAGERLVRAVHAATGGNPFFITEIARWIVGHPEVEPSDSQMPRAVQQAIQARVGALPAECRALLEAASVIGREFSEPLLVRVARVASAAPLDKACQSGLVVRSPDGSYAFQHDLVRETLYEHLASSRRSDLHRRAGREIERRHRAEIESHLPELAHHFGRGGRAAKAVDYARRAGVRAMQLLAYEQAAEHFQSALRRLARSDPQRGEILLLLGQAVARGGDVAAGRAWLLAAASEARERCDWTLVGRAALALGSAQRGFSGNFDDEMAALVEQALRHLDASAEAMRAALLARLGLELHLVGDAGRAEALTREALLLAQRTDDREAVMNAIDARRLPLYGSGDVRGRGLLVDEIIRLAEEAGEVERALWARGYRVTDLLELGDLAAVDREIETFARLVDRWRLPSFRWLPTMWTATRALIEARFDDAERLAEEAFRIGGPIRGKQAIQNYRAFRFGLFRAQGRLATIEPEARSLVDRHPSQPFPRCYLALIYAELGRDDLARSEIQGLAAGRCARLPKTLPWLFAVSCLAEACVLVEDREHAGMFHDLLVPFAGHFAVAGFGSDWAGSVSRHLGLLAGFLGRLDEAERRLEDSLLDHRRAGSGLWIARSQADLDRLSRGRARPDDVDRSSRGNALRREGQYWVASYAGVRVRLKDTKGLAAIARLLSRPGQAVHVAELVGVHVQDPTAPAPDRPGLGPVIDDRARRELRRRLEDLREEVAVAEQLNDPVRGTRAKAEMDELARYLALSYGLGGRERRLADPWERMRKAVWWRVRSSLTTIEREHASLGRHLRRSIRTGVWCVYEPDQPTDWSL